MRDCIAGCLQVAGLAGISLPAGETFDGTSLLPLLMPAPAQVNRPSPFVPSTLFGRTALLFQHCGLRSGSCSGCAAQPFLPDRPGTGRRGGQDGGV